MNAAEAKEPKHTWRSMEFTDEQKKAMDDPVDEYAYTFTFKHVQGAETLNAWLKKDRLATEAKVLGMIIDEFAPHYQGTTVQKMRRKATGFIQLMDDRLARALEKEIRTQILAHARSGDGTTKLKAALKLCHTAMLTELEIIEP